MINWFTSGFSKVGHWPFSVLCFLLFSLSLADSTRADQGADGIIKQLNSYFDRVVAGDTAVQIKVQALLIEAQALGSPVAESKALLILGVMNQAKGKPNEAKLWLLRAAELRAKTNDRKGLASVYNNLGLVAQQFGSVDEAIKYAELALAIRKEINDNEGLAASFTNIGNLYEQKGLVKRAIEAQARALEYYSITSNKAGKAGANFNIGNLYKTQGNFDRSYVYYQDAITLYKELKDQSGLARVLASLSTLFVQQDQFRQALDVALESLEIRRKLGNQEDLAYSLLNVADLFLQQKNVQVVNVYLNEALQIVTTQKLLSLEVRCLKLLAEVNALNGLWDKAYLLHVKYEQLKDSLNQLSDMKNLARLENNFIVQQKETELIQMQTERERSTKELLLKENDLLKTKQYLWTGAIGLALLLVLASFYFISSRKLEQLNQELTAKSTELSIQNKLVHEKNKAIIDSLEYAHQLQTSLEPDHTKLLPFGLDVQVVNKPRDIVSGDFSWSFTDQDGAIFIIADCVGHGVRGSMLTMYGQVLLNEIITSTKSISPQMLLAEIDRRLTYQFTQPEAMPTGMMEMAVFHYRKQDHRLIFASSRLPLFIASLDGQVETLKSGQVALGNSMVKFKEYPEHELSLAKGMSYFVASDGLADQFGGPQQKKFTRKRFRETIMDSSRLDNKSSDDRLAYLMGVIDRWQGTLPQTDDIIVSAISVI